MLPLPPPGSYAPGIEDQGCLNQISLMTSANCCSSASSLWYALSYIVDENRQVFHVAKFILGSLGDLSTVSPVPCLVSLAVFLHVRT